MFKIVLWQWAGLGLLTAAFALFLDVRAAWSCFLGGACYALPTVLAVLLLNFFRARPRWAAISFLWGESLKVILTMTAMVAVFWFYPQLMWLPFLCGLLAVSHIVFFMIWKMHYGNK